VNHSQRHRPFNYGSTGCLFIVTLTILVLLFPGRPICAGRSLVDDLGREVPVPEAPGRIISLAPNLTEILFALGLSERVVGVTKFSDYPEEAKQKPTVGTYISQNVEKIIALKPDLILSTFGGNREDTIVRLEKLGLPVYVTKATTIGDIFVMIKTVGRITNTEVRATELVSDLENRVAAVIDSVKDSPRPLVFLQVNAKPLMTAGGNTFHHQVIELAGGKNLAGSSPIRYPQYSIEDVIQRGPDVILISTMDRSGLFQRQKAAWMQWQEIPAVRTNRVYFLDSDLVDRASPRIVEGLERMARLIHPERF
jgi:iron complex transport system substrate-binding protein